MGLPALNHGQHRRKDSNGDRIAQPFPCWRECGDWVIPIQTTRTDHRTTIHSKTRSPHSQYTRNENCVQCRRMNTYCIAIQTHSCVCLPTNMMNKHSWHNGGSACLGNVSASGKDTVKAIDSPKGVYCSWMCVQTVARRLRSGGIAWTGSRSTTTKRQQW